MQNKNPMHSLAFISLFFVIIIIIITILSNQCVVRACTWTVEISILVKTETLRLESEKR